MTKVCRLCLTRLQRGSKYFNINAVESFTGFMPYRDQLTTCIPEMALDLIPCPVICNNCRTALKSSYDFKSRCLLVEKKIREYVESLPMETSHFDLSVIDTSELPKITRIATAAEVEQAKKDPQEKKQERKKSPDLKETSLLSNLLTLKKEEILNQNTSKANASYQMTNAVTDREHSPYSTHPSANEALQNKQFLCNHCKMVFPDVPSLHKHKQSQHEEEFLCNFCNQPFRSLQNLRRHNIQCQKISQTDPSQSVQIANTILTKRPHLPMKAKNHLKKWLFRHTDHPYPTDVEKQQLMKETGLSLLQVENWFINARRRILGDLTKLKNMRGRGRQKTKPCKEQPPELDFDNEDLDLEQDPEKILEASEDFEEIVPLSALKKLNESLKMDIDSSMEKNSSLDENGEDSTDENTTFDSTSMLQITSVEGGVGDEDDVEGKNGEDGGHPLAGSSEDSEDVPEIPMPMNMKMEIVDEEFKLSNNKKPKLSNVKQEPPIIDDAGENSSE